jgi:hypothetical protein
MGTLGNGALQVRWSNISNGPLFASADRKSILGLFAARDYERGDIVTSYGGIKRDLHEFRKKPLGAGSHVRLIPGSWNCMDGGLWASQFDRKTSDSEPNQVNLRPDCGIELKEEILRSGVGYMANTGPRGKWNIKVEAVHPHADKLADPVLFFVATKKIMIGEEIFSPYHNWWSRMKKMGFSDREFF